MAERFSKPNPAIKKNVLRSRSAARNARAAHASIVATSLLASLCAWALFSHQDAQTLAAANATPSNQTATSAPVQNEANPPALLQIAR
jgi:hypothetical protein